MRNLLNVRAFSTSSARSNLARFTAIGRIGTDLEEQTANSGRKFLRYALAVNGPKNSTSWYNIFVFDENPINFMTENVKKGALVYVEADMSLSTREEEEGAKRVNLNLVQRDIRFVGGRRKPAEGEETHEH
ncbi:single-stranded DNA-binding protein Rim1p, mitochondrial [Trichomonascus vanleenenianus]|uniref:Rim1p n=1 Tax=Trichomonascus vanleenenianus TaxID=2268995 RepID=UPI003ECB4E49